MNRVVLKKGRERSVENRHPWIFSGALEEKSCALLASGEDAASPLGETVEVIAADGRCLGYGAYSPASQIRVRMLSFDPKRVPDAAFVAGLVTASVARRASFFASTSTTNACRVINAENDGLPGVVADSYDGHIVCQFTSAGAEHWKPTIVEALMGSVPGAKGVSERTDLKDRVKEGLNLLTSGEDAASPGSVEPSALHLSPSPAFASLAGAEPPELIEIFEGPIRYFVDPRKGHKTGFYLDQRDARAAVGALAKGRAVLNCFSYTGGFGLAAAAGGATHVTQVDVSSDALALARKNAELTSVHLRLTPPPSSLFDYVEADVFQYLRQCRDARKTFELIVLDPPKFAETKSQVMKAARGYKDINLLAMKLLAPGGILATFSCSGAMTTDLFDKILAEAAIDARRDFQMIGRTRQGADHPVALAFPEGLYLKGVVLRAL